MTYIVAYTIISSLALPVCFPGTPLEGCFRKKKGDLVIEVLGNEIMFKPESLAALRAKDAPALRVSYSELKEQYETVLDERERAETQFKEERLYAEKKFEDERASTNKKLERMREKNHDLQVALDAADAKAASVSKFGLELEQAKSKIAELQAARKQEVANSKALQSELAEAQRRMQELDDARSTAVAENRRLNGFRDTIQELHDSTTEAFRNVDALGDSSDLLDMEPVNDDEMALDLGQNPPAPLPNSTLTVEEPAKGDAAEEGPDSPLIAGFETPNPDHDVESKAEVPEEPEPSPPPTQAPAPTPKGAYLAELEASQDDNKPPVDSTIPIDPFLAAAQCQKRDASAADLASDPNTEPVRQENWVTRLEGMACQSPPGGPERKKPRLDLFGRASQEPASFAEVQPAVTKDPAIHDASTAKQPEWREERRDVSSDEY